MEAWGRRKRWRFGKEEVEEKEIGNKKKQKEEIRRRMKKIRRKERRLCPWLSHLATPGQIGGFGRSHHLRRKISEMVRVRFRLGLINSRAFNTKPIREILVWVVTELVIISCSRATVLLPRPKKQRHGR